MVLKDADGRVVATVVTNPDGTYTFAGIAPGIYSIEELQPGGYGSTTPNTITGLTVTADGVTGADFGESLSSVGGSVFNDADGDGVRDRTEGGIGGVTITVRGTDAYGNPVVRTTVTEADGSWHIDDLLPSDGSGYTITETQPEGWIDWLDHLAVTLGVAGNDSLSGLVLGAGEKVDIGTFSEVAGVQISDSVWDDVNGNGVRDTGESGIAGVTVTLVGTDATGAPVKVTVTTGPDGSYSFTGVVPGTYHIEFHPDGLIPTWTNIGTNESIDSDVDSNGSTGSFTIIGNSSPTDHSSDRHDIAAGLVKPATITGAFMTESGKLSTCSVARLVSAGADGQFGTADDPAAISFTPEGGRYHFERLIAGAYRVESPCGATKSLTVTPGIEVGANILLPDTPSALAFTGSGRLVTLLGGAVLLLASGLALRVRTRRRSS